ncbi:MAG TPA: DinB family protein [Candidatus Sumerlaeota bacterium]|nr:DinB family protein [Candidatus Sumerlaeota bacterium]HNM45447.1 DinB family protein [Candidatus Sumerlaeota bacterium]
MSGMIDGLVGEFEHESIGTRKTLERLPESLFGYKPHPKSFSAGHLAAHLVEINYWGVVTVKQSEFNVLPDYKTPEYKTTAELLAAYDRLKGDFVAALKEMKESTVFEPWTLKVNGVAVFSMPRIATLRGFVFSHTVHHRAQLGLYLRLNNIPVPSIYGPSADEGMMGS